MRGVDGEMNDLIMRALLPFAEGLAAYHQHEVIGLKNIPAQGSALIVSNHSLATYDIVLLLYKLFKETGRVSRPLIDRLFFKIPGLGQIMDMTGAVQGGRDDAKRLLSAGHIVCVAPGGMREALRPSSERYQIMWERRKGFVRVALETHSPIILAACPKADDLYEVYDNPVTKWAYKNFRVPLFLARGLGFTPIPRPVHLIHFVSKPIKPPKMSDDPAVADQQVEDLHAKVVEEMQKLIGRAIAHRPKARRR